MSDENAKIIGELDDEEGVGVLGKATGTGDTAGVKGEADSEDGVGLYTPDDAKIDGRMVSVGDWIVEIEPTDGDAPNVIHGDRWTSVDENAVGATISGGDEHAIAHNYSTIGGGRNNEANSAHATVAGGDGNTASYFYAAVGGGTDNTSAGSRSTVAGGGNNTASAGWSTVAGGRNNEASGSDATVIGGRDNVASGDRSLAAGNQAKADHVGSFVWSDGNSSELESTDENQFLVDAEGGVGIGTDAPEGKMHVMPDSGSIGLVLENSSDVNGWAMGTGHSSGHLNFYYNSNVTDDWGGYTARIEAITGQYQTNSDRRLKEGVEHLDGILEDICSLRPARYQFAAATDDEPSYGFIAQEVSEVFPELPSEGEDGFLSLCYDQFTALAVQAIKEQQEIIETQAQKLEAQQERIEKQTRKIEEQSQDIEALEVGHDDLEARLAALESDGMAASTTPADD